MPRATLNRAIALAGLTLLVVWPAGRARAIVLYETAGQNTSDPSATLGSAYANSGFALQGSFGVGSGTPIAPGYFLTAAHLGGVVGQSTLTLGGVSYTTAAVYDDPHSDLAIWKINGTFPSYAPLYLGSDEVGQNLIAFGRGVPRLDTATGGVYVNGVLKGWTWGSSAAPPLSWGLNQVVAAASAGAGGPPGQFLALPFASPAGAAQYFPGASTLAGQSGFTAGDSGGGVFLRGPDGIWRLAGINYGVDGYYSYAGGASFNAFNASIFDQRGLYLGTNASNTLITGAGPVPSESYATRVSAEQAWIATIVPSAVPEPAGFALLAAGVVALVAGSRLRRPIG